MTDDMIALVYEAPYQMPLRRVPLPELESDAVLIRVAYSGICGSELNGYEGKNAIRQPPLIMGHEFSGHIAAIGHEAQQRPELAVGLPVAVNPLISCRQCAYCMSGRQQICSRRKLHSAHLPGSNAGYIAARADAVYLLPEGMNLKTASLAEPAACAIHAAELAAPKPHETGLVVGAGPIGLFIIQALREYSLKTILVAERNPERAAMAQSFGATQVELNQSALQDTVDVAVEAVGISVTRQACIPALRAGGRVIWVGNHDAETPLPVTDMVRREIVCYGSYAYTPLDFQKALLALAAGRMSLDERWTRTEPLANGTACFEELLRGSPIAKIWLAPHA